MVLVSRAMIRTGLPLAALFLVACAEPARQAPIVPLPASPPIASSSTSEAAEGAPPAEPAAVETRTVELPAAVACALPTARWRGTKPASELRVRADGPVFARIVSGKGLLHFPVGSPAAGAILEVADKALAVRGHLAREDIWLHPGKAFVMGDAVIPLGPAHLDWTSARAGALGVSFVPGEGITLVQPPLVAEVPCDALGLEDGAFDEDDAIPGAPKQPGKIGLLRAGHPVSLARTAGGPVIATLVPRPGLDAAITVLGASGKHTRIVWTRDSSAIFGWVATADLEFPKKLPSGMGYGSGSGSGLGSSVHPISRRVCPGNVEAVVEIGGERWIVGQILAGATINVMTGEGQYRTVVMRGDGVEIVDPAILMVLARSIERCPEAP
jgi:hypothetical protein